MEILIIGGILVLIMVLVSTRIKKSAAEAFEEEMVETDEFSILKPEGFLHPLREPRDFPFEAYSKLFGERSTRNIWRARARLRIYDGDRLDEIARETSESEEVVSSETSETGDETLIDSRRTEDDIIFLVKRKIVQKNGRTFELRATMLVPYDEEYSGRISALIDSFTVK
ncbi:MAG: hypothetical protein DWQ47_09870 [Acidobacteria bacterium]|nr:MAG: hypothetical protein DWQ32_12285 [Acidobacteriota bacterium]REJ98703.1 MAG: hypothetical protein DWQ38_15195 [Acidobacteriota bacterium]REK16642.1 MAG: hypothetical protein DWQ43_00130 [Acidobacteriota bacterium]REK42553.1 MAG: hypothetical protein DWQ47_09870 [Acidobacteriota bacterium]